MWLESAEEKARSGNLDNTLSCDQLLGIDPSRFFFRVQVWRSFAYCVQISSPVRNMNDVRWIQRVLFSPSTHDPLIADGGIKNRVVHVEQDSGTANFNQSRPPCECLKIKFGKRQILVFQVCSERKVFVPVIGGHIMAARPNVVTNRASNGMIERRHTLLLHSLFPK
jgi:hypothetical protein